MKESFVLHIFRALRPLKPTVKGLAYVQSEDFRRHCKEIAASVILAGLPEETIEQRLAYITVQALLPQGRNYSVDETEQFYRANWQLVEKSWRQAIAPMMETVDADLIGTLRRELGIDLPSSARNDVAHLLDSAPPGTKPLYHGLKEGTDFRYAK
jgi:hypothetical protein